MCALKNKKKKKSNDRENRTVASIWTNTNDETGEEYLSLSGAKPFVGKDKKSKGGTLLFQDEATGNVYEVKSARVFDAQDSEYDKPENLVFEIVVDLKNDYQVDELED